MATLGSAPGIMIGTGVGAAVAAALQPIVEPARQQAWADAPNRVLTPALYAQLVAQGALDLGVGQGLGAREGMNEDQFNRLVHLALRAPPHAEAQDLRRRNKITLDQLYHSFAKDQIEHQYWEALADLVDDRLSAQAVALGIIRSLIKDPGFFPVTLDTSGGVVPSYPVSSLDPIAEAAATGFDEERLRVMVGSIGRPPGPNELARAFFRGLVQLPDFNRGILEGDTRPEWADTFLNVSREILTAGQYAELQLRGFLTAAQRQANTDKHGMSAADSELLYNLLGRAIPEHQVVTGEARGGTFDGPIDTIPRAFLSALQRGNIRPEYYNLAYANRYSYPSGFQIKAETQDGALPEAEAEQLLLEVGWSPHWAAFFAKAWAAKAGTSGSTDPYVKKAENQLWTALHKAYVKTGASRTDVEPILIHLIPDQAARFQVIDLWDLERQTDAITPTAPPPIG